MKPPSLYVAAITMSLALSLLSPLQAESTGRQAFCDLMTASKEQISGLLKNSTRLDAPEVAELREKLDKAAHQRDAYASGLFWHTDLEAAKAEAVQTGKQILSLRLLGKLNEEYSCANSRFFRTVLYANATVSKQLRDHYILHWKSVRPAPLLTIDMGDGRRIKRTITGNSIHYILNPQGQVMDALPGIYTPEAFLQALSRAEAGALNKKSTEFRAWHGSEAHQLCQEWLLAAAQVGAYGVEIQKEVEISGKYSAALKSIAKHAFPASHKIEQASFDATDAGITRRFSAPTSAKRIEVIKEFPYPTDFEPPDTPKAMVERPMLQGTFDGPATIALDPATPQGRSRSLAIKEFPYPTEFDPPKGMVERPLMQGIFEGPATIALDPATPQVGSQSLAGRMTAELWQKIGAQVTANAHLDEASRRLMLQKQPAGLAMETELANGAPDAPITPFGAMLAKFESAIAGDAARNEYFYHTQIHQWLEEDVTGSLQADVELLNQRVYKELFLTPDYDAWLGLVPENTYTALDKDGCACDAGAQPMRQRQMTVSPR